MKKEKEPGGLFYFFLVIFVLAYMINRGLRTFEIDYWHNLAFVKWVHNHVPIWLVSGTMIISSFFYSVIWIWKPDYFRWRFWLGVVWATTVSLILMIMSDNDPSQQPLQVALTVAILFYVFGYLYKKITRKKTDSRERNE